MSDIGYEMAGFGVKVQSEIEPNRVNMAKVNFPNSSVIVGDIKTKRREIIDAFQELNIPSLDLMSITPPCQGMSSSNPARGRMSNLTLRDARNRLMLDTIPIIRALQPRVIVVENVPQILQEMLHVRGGTRSILDIFRRGIGDEQYRLYSGVLQMADYGIAQNRKRAIIVGIRSDENVIEYLENEQFLPWPASTHSNKRDRLDNWITAGEWFDEMAYPPLDACSQDTSQDPGDPLHVVTHYENEPHRYQWIADIPARSGFSAYQNSNCHNCGRNDVEEGLAHCSFCGQPMWNRPHVIEDGRVRLIKGYSTAYRRIPVNKITPTITTSSSHLGSNYKIHPWENRILSIRECADLQTIPRFYDWSWALGTRHTYLARKVIGEALPAWFTYRHGLVIKSLLMGEYDNLSLARVQT